MTENAENLPWSGYQRGENADVFAIDDRKLAQAACLTLARQARRQVDILHPTLDKFLLGDLALSAALRQWLTRESKARLRILLHTSQVAMQEGQPLLQLRQLLPSFVQVRVLPEVYQGKQQDAFFLVDVVAFFIQPLYSQYNGRFTLYQPLEGKSLAERFQGLWDKSEEDSASRRLSL
jgi:hypothetical protein